MPDVKLDHPNGQISMPVHQAAEGPSGIEVGKLLADTGFVTYDPGYVNTASAHPPSRSSTAMRASCATGATRSTSSPRSRRFSRSRTC